MSKHLLQHSVFYEVLFPSVSANAEDMEDFNLLRCVSFQPHGDLLVSSHPVVVFDFETTGLNADQDQIIEIGAQKIANGTVVGEFSTLVSCSEPLSQAVVQITGITDDMLKGQPPLNQVLEDFLRFINGCILVAHNATFDMSFLVNACKQHGIDISYPAFCTLKLARQLLPDLSRKNLDTLAEHYGLVFEARHRSIGDVKVTAAVLQELLANEGAHLKTWADFQPYAVSV